VFHAIVLKKILYALPVYFGYLTEGQRHMLLRVVHRASSRGFSPLLWSRYTSRECSLSFFHESCRQAHCLNHQYTVKPIYRLPGAMRLKSPWSWVWIAYYYKSSAVAEMADRDHNSVGCHTSA